jgi:hypothetical protein
MKNAISLSKMEHPYIHLNNSNDSASSVSSAPSAPSTPSAIPAPSVPFIRNEIEFKKPSKNSIAKFKKPEGTLQQLFNNIPISNNSLSRFNPNEQANIRAKAQQFRESSSSSSSSSQTPNHIFNSNQSLFNTGVALNQSLQESQLPKPLKPSVSTLNTLKPSVSTLNTLKPSVSTLNTLKQKRLGLFNNLRRRPQTAKQRNEIQSKIKAVESNIQKEQNIENELKKLSQGGSKSPLLHQQIHHKQYKNTRRNKHQ